MTMDERIQAIEVFGYTEPEARFLCQVALHGGYFVRRQFLHSAGCEPGKRAQDFIEKMAGRKHVSREVYREDRHLFRLQYKPIYAAIGEQDNRNRREHQPSTIRLRLMGLDFVLEHSEYQFLSSEQDKLRYLLDNCQIDANVLPARAYCVRATFTTRHFVDGFPVFLAGSESAIPSFSFIDDDQLTTAAFRSYLVQYHRLFQALGPVTLVFVTRHPGRFEAAQKALDRFCDRYSERTTSSIDITRLLAHFPHRLLLEQRQTRPLDRAQLDQLRTDLDLFDGPQYSRLFELWKVSGDEPVRAELEDENDMRRKLQIHFTPSVLEHDYDLFGTLQAES